MRLQQVLGRDPLLDQLGFLAADFGEILADIGAQVLVDLDDLELGLGDAPRAWAIEAISAPRSPSSGRRRARASSSG